MHSAPQTPRASAGQPETAQSQNCERSSQDVSEEQEPLGLESMTWTRASLILAALEIAAVIFFRFILPLAILSLVYALLIWRAVLALGVAILIFWAFLRWR